MYTMKQCVVAVGPLLIGMSGVAVAAPTPEAMEHFEKHIRPVLVDHCYACHGGDPAKVKGGLNLTYRDGLLTGGSGGPALVPGSPENSLLFEAIQYHNTDLQMPPDGKMADDLVSHFRTWITDGAVDPRDTPPSAEDLSNAMSWETVRERRMAWWSFQPVQDVEPPADAPAEWAANPIDAFMWAQRTEAGVSASELTDARSLVRRLYFVLTGLPPSPDDVTRFVQASSLDWDRAVETTVDRLLASPAFGERWGRHWMDWMRYAESHGSEGDPEIPHAWRYRDYIIRALNADVPYDDLVREHLAGDRLPTPRIHPETGVNESMLGTAQYRFVLHGYSPTDALDERVRFVDNQIDVVSKAFLGMTVSCARCHNHKFDPISQKDYYALFGVMATGHPATVTVDSKARQEINTSAIAETKAKMRAVMAEKWLAYIEDGLAEPMRQTEGGWENALNNATSNQNPLHPWQRLRSANGGNFEKGWRELKAQWNGSNYNMRQRLETPYPKTWNLGGVDARAWVQHGNGLNGTVAPAGSFDIRDVGEPIIRGIYPAGLYSHLTSTKHSGVLASPRFDINDKQIYVRVAGDGDARHRYVVQDFPRNGQVYPMTRLNGGHWRWQRWDLTYWLGDEAHLELSTANDQAVLASDEITRSWFGISEVVIVADGQPAPRDEMAEFVAPLFAPEGQPKNPDELLARYQQSLRDCVIAWRDGTMSDEQARYLNFFVSWGLLPNTAEKVPEAAALLEEYRHLESEIPFPTRAPGVVESAPINQPLFTRGDHKQPGAPVERRFLEAINPTPFGDNDAGRLALAEEIVSDNNPLSARIMANRLWHHTFGRGLVATPDNFGVMGEKPTHPALLDYLARRVREHGWSTKALLRELTTSRTFQQSALPTETAREKDPANHLWSHAMVRRLEAEAIRDAMLAASGRLKSEPVSKPVPGGDPHRSVYVRVVRNDLDPFLTIFDAPTPVSTKGRRDVTNVPAHALALMNDPFVQANARTLAARVSAESDDANQRVKRLYELTLGRAPSDTEQRRLLDFVAETSKRPAGRELDARLNEELTALEAQLAEIQAQFTSRLEIALKETPELAREPERKQWESVSPELFKERESLRARLAPLARLGGPAEPWVEVAQSLFSLKEFSYLR